MLEIENNKRMAFDQVKALLYPATLMVVIDGKAKKLSSPEEATAFVECGQYHGGLCCNYRREWVMLNSPMLQMFFS